MVKGTGYGPIFQHGCGGHLFIDCQVTVEVFLKEQFNQKITLFYHLDTHDSFYNLMIVTSKIIYKRAIQIVKSYSHYFTHDAFQFLFIIIIILYRSENCYAQSDFLTLSHIATGRGSL